MVKLIAALLLLALSLFGEASVENPLQKKIKALLDKGVYEQNRAYIKIIFSPESNFYTKERVDSLKVVKTLQDNGLLSLFFEKPREVELKFKTSGSPLFFVKIMGDTLRNIGYYKYVTKASTLSSSEFTWVITLTSEYATDPMVLQKELQKSGCEMIDIERSSKTDWSYTIDMSSARLNVEQLQSGENIELKKSLYDQWIDVSKIKSLTIKSSNRNTWYPHIVYYDKSMHLLKVIKEDVKSQQIELAIPKYAEYIKISDIYTVKNIRDPLKLYPGGTK
ncbi:MAG: hypothetical protein IE916_06880 [Epsilonproteobacteria bacterium]|nr:hypothetical protein [Campylobacterota bacterium]